MGRRSALVVGGAACVWDDLREARELFAPDIVLAVNTIAIELERLDHWVSLHPQKFVDWIERRRAKGRADPAFWAHKQPRSSCKVNVVALPEDAPEMNGTSVLFAVIIALRELDCGRIVVAGAPMDETGYFDGPSGHSSQWKRHLHEKYRPAWRAMRDELVPRVTSMSGWTAKLLGRPDDDWLRSEAA